MYADDMAILCLKIIFEDLQTFKINMPKTNCMEEGIIDVGPCKLELNDEIINFVNHFKFLGNWLKAEGNLDEKTLAHTEMSCRSSVSWKPVLCNRPLWMHLSKSVLKWYIWSIYGCVAFGVTNWRSSKYAFDGTSNVDILGRMYTKRKLEDTVKTRKTINLGRIFEGPKYWFLSLSGKGEGRRKMNQQTSETKHNIKITKNTSLIINKILKFNKCIVSTTLISLKDEKCLINNQNIN